MRLIDADALRRESRMLYDIHHFEPVEAYMQEQIDAALTIDAAPVVHGQWIKEWSDILGMEVEHCSHCQAEMNDRNKFWDAPHCPSCGAKTDKEA